MEFILAGIALLFLVALVYTIRRGKNKEKRQLERIRELEARLETIKNRHLTASGGLSRAEKIRLLDLIGKLDLIESESEILKLRITDAKAEATNIMKTRR